MMKYIVSRTSGWREYDEESPCEGAEKVILDRYRDIRSFKSKEVWLRKFPEDADEALEWGVTEYGRPYRIVVRSTVIWVMDIPDLHAFVKEVGRIVVSLPSRNYIGYEDILQVEIYDDYRE